MGRVRRPSGNRNLKRRCPFGLILAALDCGCRPRSHTVKAIPNARDNKRRRRCGVRDLAACPGAVAFHRRGVALTSRCLHQLTPALRDAADSATTKRERTPPPPFSRRFSELGNGGTPMPPARPPPGRDDGDGHVLAQLLHPRSGVALTPPKLSTFGAPSSALVSACFSPDAACAWLADHSHDADAAAAARRLRRWRAARVVAPVAPPTPTSPREGSDAQLRFIDAWEVPRRRRRLSGGFG